MKAFKPDGSRWFARTLPELIEQWAAPLCVSEPGVPALDVVTLDVVISMGKRFDARPALDAKAKAATRVRALRAHLAELKENALQDGRTALQQMLDAPPNRHERRALGKGQIPTRMLPQKGRPRHIGAGARRGVRR